jgi:tRNA-splicing ligase RtcB
LSESEIDEVLVHGAEYAIKKGYGFKGDLEFIEENGKMSGADPHAVSHQAKKRQFKQVGTLGSGNHYLEVQVVEEIFDEKIAKAYGLSMGQLLVSIHCGSRALGHQIGTDYLKELAAATRKYNLPLKDKELVSAPIQSPEGQKYFSAVKAGINTAFANRQAIAHLARQGLNKALGVDPKKVQTFYEVGHNTAKIEKHSIDGKMKEVLVQRKGSTRGFGPGREEVPSAYRSVGQPILVGGTMGTHSYILAGTEKAMQETFGSSVHGAGRLMSRKQATKQFRAEKLVSDLKEKGMIIKGHGFKGIAE